MSLGALRDGAFVGGEGDEVRAVQLVAQVAQVAGCGLGDAQEQDASQQELNVGLDPSSRR